MSAMTDESESETRGAGFEPGLWRLLAVASLVLIACDAWLLFNAARQGLWLVDGNGAPAPLDFSAFWAAGRLAVGGHAAAAYDWAALRHVVEESFGRPFADANYPIFYPPVFLLYIAPLGLFSYFGAAVVWLGATLALYLAAAYAILPKRVSLLIALAAPAVLWTVCVGQNGLLTAALLGGALALLDRRPVVAGILFGAMIYKPQFGLLIPFALMATGRWRSFFAASATAVFLLALSGLVFGWSIYPAFLDAIGSANDRLLNVGSLPWYKVQSVYGLARTLHLPAGAAWAIHGGVAAAMAAATVLLWRANASHEIKAAALADATIVLSPYSCIYDLPVLSVAVLFLLKDSFGRPASGSDHAATGFAFLLPLFFPTLGFPVGPIASAALGFVIFRRGKWW